MSLSAIYAANMTLKLIYLKFKLIRDISARKYILRTINRTQMCYCNELIANTKYTI